MYWWIMMNLKARSCELTQGLWPVMLVIGCAVTGCSSTVVLKKDRTTNTSYNGEWVGKVDSPAFTVLQDDLVLDCNALNISIKVNVSGGRVQAVASHELAVPFDAVINDDGRFYAEVPRESEYLINGRSRFGAKEFHVYKGTLNPDSGSGEGSYVSALGSMGDGGCRYPFTFELKNNNVTT